MNDAQDKTLQVEFNYQKNSGEVFVDISINGLKSVVRLSLEQAQCLSQCLQDGFNRLTQLGLTKLDAAHRQ